MEFSDEFPDGKKHYQPIDNIQQEMLIDVHFSTLY